MGVVKVYCLPDRESLTSTFLEFSILHPKLNIIANDVKILINFLFKDSGSQNKNKVLN